MTCKDKGSYESSPPCTKFTLQTDYRAVFEEYRANYRGTLQAKQRRISYVSLIKIL